MTAIPLDTHSLAPLRESDLSVADAGSDVRGRSVVDDRGTVLGRIDDLIIDPVERQVRLLRVRRGRILGVGGRTSLIPAEAISAVTRTTVAVAMEGDRIPTPPLYQPTIVAKPARFHDPDADEYPAYWAYWTNGYPYIGGYRRR